MQSSKLSLAVALSLMFVVPGIGQSGRARRVNPPPEPVSTKPEPAPELAASEPAARDASSLPAVVASSPARYVGGSLQLDDGTKVTVDIKDHQISILTKRPEIVVPVGQVRSITYTQDARQRTAEGVGVGVVIPAAGTIIGNSRSIAHYIEIVWEGAPPGGAVLKVDKDDYRGLLVALEAATGLTAKHEMAPPVRDWTP